jgi:hypothetical protein
MMEVFMSSNTMTTGQTACYRTGQIMNSQQKQQKTPKDELQLAEDRMKEVQK